MQPYQYALSASIALLILLATLPYLFGKARRSAFDLGKEIGLAERDAAHLTKVRDLAYELNEIAVQRESEQRKHLTTIADLKRTVSELETRIMSYTGLAVTRSDYERLLSTVEALRLAQQVHIALKARDQADRTAELATAVDELAKRAHAHLRATPSGRALTDALA